MAPSESEVRDARAWTVRKIQDEAAKRGITVKRDDAERIVRDTHKVDEGKRPGDKREK